MRALKRYTVTAEHRFHSVTTQAHEGIETPPSVSSPSVSPVTTQAHEGIETMRSPARMR